MYLLAASLAATLLDDLSEQPAGHPDPVGHQAHRSVCKTTQGLSTHDSFIALPDMPQAWPVLLLRVRK
jgi:hypothetical protein